LQFRTVAFDPTRRFSRAQRRHGQARNAQGNQLETMFGRRGEGIGCVYRAAAISMVLIDSIWRLVFQMDVNSFNISKSACRKLHLMDRELGEAKQKPASIRCSVERNHLHAVHWK